jgi:hypothetical protein
MIRKQSAITLQLQEATTSGPATLALEQQQLCLKRRREEDDNDEKKTTTSKHHRSKNHSCDNSLSSFNDMFECIASEVAGEASFPSIEWDFDDDDDE